MTCDWVPKLDLYVDGELSGGELKEVGAHLQACPTCAADALNRLQLKRMTQSAGRRFSPRPEFRLKVAQSIGAAVSRNPRPSTIHNTSARCAPIAIRTPISRVRCATVYATTP